MQMGLLTHRSNDLSFETELIRKTPSEVINASRTIPGDVRYFTNVIEHVTAREEKDNDQAYSGPYVPILKNR